MIVVFRSFMFWSLWALGRVQNVANCALYKYTPKLYVIDNFKLYKPKTNCKKIQLAFRVSSARKMNFSKWFIFLFLVTLQSNCNDGTPLYPNSTNKSYDTKHGLYFWKTHLYRHISCSGSVLPSSWTVATRCLLPIKN